jgi:hypothetical protein
MKPSGIVLALVVACGSAAAQDSLDEKIKELAGKISKDGVSGRLAEAAATDPGIQAVHEKIDFLLSTRLSRVERDPTDCMEDYLFTADANGDLHLRPERKPEFEELRRRLPDAMKAMAGFNRRADQIVKRLGDASEMDRQAKAAWNDSGFRAAFFHRHPAELRQLDEVEQLEVQGFRGLERQADGKLRVTGPYLQELRDRISGAFEALEALKPYEKSYLKAVAALTDPAARALLSGDTAILFLLGRVYRQTAEGSDTPIGTATEGDEDKKIEPSVAFNIDLAEFVPAIKECEASLPALQQRLEAFGRDLAGGGAEETNVIEYLRNGRARVLLAERLLAARDEQQRKADEILNSTLEEDFTSDGERLSVKKGKYLDDDGKESPALLLEALNAIRAEFEGTIRQDFDRIAERCTDAEVISVFENRPGTYLLMDFRDRVADRLSDAIRRQGLDVFIRAYLLKQGDGYIVRPDKTVRVEALLRRAEQIKKEQEQQK